MINIKYYINDRESFVGTNNWIIEHIIDKRPIHPAPFEYVINNTHVGWVEAKFTYDEDALASMLKFNIYGN